MTIRRLFGVEVQQMNTFSKCIVVAYSLPLDAAVSFLQTLTKPEVELLFGKELTRLLPGLSAATLHVGGLQITLETIGRGSTVPAFQRKMIGLMNPKVEKAKRIRLLRYVSGKMKDQLRRYFSTSSSSDRRLAKIIAFVPWKDVARSMVPVVEESVIESIAHKSHDQEQGALDFLRTWIKLYPQADVVQCVIDALNYSGNDEIIKNVESAFPLMATQVQEMCTQL
eukprot:m.32842 g.32842  ORF g.32842 m.32842 type:complete len:225 (+) comp31704_c0_seq1:692-1366(+)